jgi:peptide/nickel transport system permease protein
MTSDLALAEAVVAEQPPDDQALERRLGIFFWIAIAWVVVIVMLAILAPWLPLKDPDQRYLDREHGLPPYSPGGEHWFGTDRDGRDMFARTIFGARVSLVVGFAAIAFGMLVGGTLGLVAGYFRGWGDAVIRSVLDVMWSFPVVILGVALGVALAVGGLKIGPLEIAGDSLAIPIFIIGLVYVPYMARPVRGQVLSLREKEFIEAARAQGAGPIRIMFTEVLPNLASTILVFFTLLIANAILLESALSFLGAGVQPPNPSWGTMIDEGVDRIATAPHLTIVPGLMLILTVLSLNVFGDGVRDALDPRAKVRLER